MKRPLGRQIVIIAEGATEAAAKDHLKKYLDRRAEQESLPNKIGLHIVTSGGSINGPDLRRRVEEYLRSPNTVGVVALTDVYPEFKSAEDARQRLTANMPDDPRCHVHVAKHDFEAWLLVGWQTILEHCHIEKKQPWGPRPEEINGNDPPAHRLRRLYQREAKPYRQYKKPIDGKILFGKLDLELVAAVCPEFRAFLNCLLQLAGYQPLLTSPKSADSRAGSAPWQEKSWAVSGSRGMAESIFANLKTRGILLTEERSALVLACTDSQLLGKWLERSLIVISDDELFATVRIDVMDPDT